MDKILKILYKLSRSDIGVIINTLLRKAYGVHLINCPHCSAIHNSITKDWLVSVGFDTETQENFYRCNYCDKCFTEEDCADFII